MDDYHKYCAAMQTIYKLSGKYLGDNKTAHEIVRAFGWKLRGYFLAVKPEMCIGESAREVFEGDIEEFQSSDGKRREFLKKRIVGYLRDHPETAVMYPEFKGAVDDVTYEVCYLDEYLRDWTPNGSTPFLKAYHRYLVTANGGYEEDLESIAEWNIKHPEYPPLGYYGETFSKFKKRLEARGFGVIRGTECFEGSMKRVRR